MILPVVLLLVLALVQAALVLRDDLALTNAAREAARAASLDPDPARAQRAAAAVLPGGDGRFRAPAGGGGARQGPGELPERHRPCPLVGPLLPDPVLVARAAMRVER